MPVFKKTPKTLHAVINKIVERVNTDTQRLRLLEQSLDSLNTQINTLEQNYFQSKKTIQKQLSDIKKSLSMLEDRMTKSERTLKEVIGYIKKLPTQTKVKELEELIELYNPLTSNFVTREEVLSLLKKNK